MLCSVCFHDKTSEHLSIVTGDIEKQGCETWLITLKYQNYLIFCSFSFSGSIKFVNRYHICHSKLFECKSMFILTVNNSIQLWMRYLCHSTCIKKYCAPSLPNVVIPTELGARELCGSQFLIKRFLFFEHSKKRLAWTLWIIVCPLTKLSQKDHLL